MQQILSLKTMLLAVIMLIGSVSVFGQTWEVCDINSLTSTDIFVIVDIESESAMSNNNGASSAPSAISVTLNTGKTELEGIISDNIKWNIEGDATAYTIYPEGTTAQWLYCTNTNNGVRVGTNANKTFIFDTSTNKLKHIEQNRWIGVYTSSDWRCYTSATQTNIVNTNTKFYKYVEAIIPEFSITAITSNASYGTISINRNVITASPTEIGQLNEANPYTISSGDATVNRSGNEFTVNAISDCTIQINFEAKSAYTVNFNVGNGSSTAPAPLSTIGGYITLPSVTVSDACLGADWEFAGWKENSGQDESTTAPTLFEEGTTYYPSANCTLYAVYKKTEGVGGSSVATVTNEYINLLPAIAYTNTGTFSVNGKDWAYAGVYKTATGGNQNSFQMNNTTIRYIQTPVFDGNITEVKLNIKRNASGLVSINKIDDTNITSHTVGTTQEEVVFTIPEGTNASSIKITNATGVTNIYAITVTYLSGTTTYDSNPVCDLNTPSITTNPTALSFTTIIGKISPESVTVNWKNLISDIAITITQDGDEFSVDPTSIDYTENGIVGASIDVSFSPTVIGNYTGTLVLSSSGKVINIPLTGNATNIATPIALTATETECDGFTANWEAVSEVSQYKLSVYTYETLSGSTTELVSNGNFEDDKTDWTGTDIASMTVQTANPHSGTKYLSRTGSNNARVEQVIDVEIGNTYLMSFWYNNYDASSTNGLKNYSIMGTSGGEYIEGENPVKLPAATTWTKYEKEFTATNSVVRISIRAYQLCDIDDISIVETGVLAKKQITGSPFTITETSKDITGLNSDTEYFYTVKAIAGISESEDSDEIPVTTLASSTITWLGSNSSWENPANWDERVPSQCDNVVIPASVSYYPVITDTKTINNITFEPGAEIGNQHFLTYQKATVNYNLERNKWNMMTTPIATTIGESFHFDKNPRTWVQKFTIEEDGAGWEYITDIDHSFEIGDGFVFMIDGTGNYLFSIEGNLTGESITKGLNFIQEGSAEFASVGNPFMSTIDFSTLITSNGIGSSYVIWDGNAYAGYNISIGSAFGSISNSLNQFIAPLQSFIVEKGINTGDLVFNANIQETGSGDRLKAAENETNKLDIIAENGMASMLTVVANQENGQDSYKLFAEKNDVPDIYTLKEDAALGVNIIDTDDILIPIRLSTTYNGNMSFTFNGMDNYDAKITFIDLEGETIDLTRLATYSYSFDYVPAEERFFIQFAPTNETNIYNSASGNTIVYSKDQAIYIVNPEQIKQVIVYNVQGQTIYSNDNVNDFLLKIDGKQDSVYIVKVITENGIQNVKLINNK